MLLSEQFSARTGMQTQERAGVKGLEQAITQAQNYLLSIQKPDGHWVAELESNVTITAEIVLLHKVWGIADQLPLPKVEAYLRSQQRSHGGWELFYGDGGEISTSVEAYMALRLLGVPTDDPALVKAREFILDQGGISKTRVFTKLHLALIGCYDWRGIPSIPPWIMFFKPPFPVSIYEMSSWARGSTVPLLIVFDQKPVFSPSAQPFGWMNFTPKASTRLASSYPATTIGAMCFSTWISFSNGRSITTWCPSARRA
jgi:squalene-hopene/tetraprenyl-beta-curcumene cyclase